MTSPMPPAPAQALGNQSDPNTFLTLPPIKLSPDASESDSDLRPAPSTSRPKPRPANAKTKKALLDKGKEKDVGQKADKRCNRTIPFGLGSTFKVSRRSLATCPPCSALPRGTPSPELRVPSSESDGAHSHRPALYVPHGRLEAQSI